MAATQTHPTTDPLHGLYDELYAYALKRLGCDDTAFDVVHDAFARILGRDSDRRIDQPRAYPNGLYHIGYHTPDDLMHEQPGAWVSVSPSEGRVIDVRPASGRTVGDAIHDWQFPLHSGKAFGLTGRIIICITGLVTAMLSITGVYIWWKKRGGRAPQSSPAETRRLVSQ